MKKYLLGLLAVLIIAGSAFAGTDNATIIAETLLDDAPTVATSSTMYVQENKKTAVFVKYDETQVGNTVSGAVTLQISYDGTNWISGSFYDYAGGATLQTSETLSADGWYYFWLNPDLTIPFARVIVTGANTDADDTILVTAYAVQNK